MRTLAWVAVFAVACGPLPLANTASSDLAAKNLQSSEGVTLAAACTPTGPELCFNAADDNCNGIIDEGCGAGTGVLQFMVAWGDSPADIDLSVKDPKGANVSASHRSAGGMQFEKNCPEDGCHGQNVENVFFEGSEPLRGRYVVEVKLVDLHGADLPVRARLSARIGNRTFGMGLALAPGAQDKQGFAFDL